MACMMRPPWFTRPWMRDASWGIRVRAIASDAASEMQIVMATWLMNIDISSFLPKMLGRKTMAVVSVPAVTASATASTPAMVARCGSFGKRSRFVNTLSVTTTALSTSIPMESIRPIIDRMLSVKPRKYIEPSVIRIENGTDKATMSVMGQSRRNA